MKMNLDLLRDILIAIEEKESLLDYYSVADISEIVASPENEVFYHLALLEDVNFFDGYKNSTLTHPDYQILRLTYDGHNYLNNIRDNTIWEKTKSALSSVGSSASVEIIGQLASSVIRKTLNIE